MQNKFSGLSTGSRSLERRRTSPTGRKVMEQFYAKRPKETDFIGDPYTKEEVEEDQWRVESREALAAKTPVSREDAENKELADRFEAVVSALINEAGLMGEWGEATPTGKYDEKINKIDMVVELQWVGSVSHLGLAADATFSSKPEVIVKKFEAIRDRINRGVLGEVKYFQSPHTKAKHPLTKIPEVVIGVSKRTVEELWHLLESGNYAALAEHPAGIKLLRQMEIQLITFERHAKSVNQPEAGRIYSHMLIMIQKILAEKADLVAKVESIPNTDPVHDEMMKFMRNWSRY